MLRYFPQHEPPVYVVDSPAMQAAREKALQLPPPPLAPKPFARVGARAAVVAFLERGGSWTMREIAQRTGLEMRQTNSALTHLQQQRCVKQLVEHRTTWRGRRYYWVGR